MMQKGGDKLKLKGGVLLKKSTNPTNNDKDEPIILGDNELSPNELILQKQAMLQFQDENKKKKGHKNNYEDEKKLKAFAKKNRVDEIAANAMADLGLPKSTSSAQPKSLSIAPLKLTIVSQHKLISTSSSKPISTAPTTKPRPFAPKPIKPRSTTHKSSDLKSSVVHKSILILSMDPISFAFPTTFPTKPTSFDSLPLSKLIPNISSSRKWKCILLIEDDNVSSPSIHKPVETPK
ncbi:hypothetical protein L1987_13165 [Smallanthus sonchifolius]|uniref:Uncharacterized protein n=1 Tax=Smallanthus sonchifolius TaxID=185202 RepID=A0ACB9JG63_9ASTR|nr:hypothetical protein L1987_13165 [Smallanthus sonchifolius]